MDEGLADKALSTLTPGYAPKRPRLPAPAQGQKPPLAAPPVPGVLDGSRMRGRTRPEISVERSCNAAHEGPAAIGDDEAVADA